MPVVRDSKGMYTLTMSDERKKEIALALVKRILTQDMWLERLVKTETSYKPSRMNLADYLQPGHLMCISWESPDAGLDRPEALEFLEALREDILKNQMERSSQKDAQGGSDDERQHQ